jgi:hypothetical protein
LSQVEEYGDIAWCYPERFGHLNFDALEKMGWLAMARGTCGSVLQHLRHQQALSQRVPSASKVSRTHGGRCYFLLLVDDATCYMYVMLLAGKNNAPNAIKRVQTVEAQSGCKLRVFRTDSGG